MIEVENLTKYYGRMAAIRDVNFRVESGEIVGFLGPNAAGKTTTMRILTCFAPASAGNVRILGMDVREDSLKIRRKLGYLPEHVPLYDWMRVQGYLEFVARAKGIPSSERQTEIRRVIEEVGLDQVTHKLIKWLSKGYRQRVGLAQALIGDPPILVLDEPTIGLDPKQIREIRLLIKGFAHNRTVILSTHILPEVSQVCDRVIIINKGSIVAEDSPANLARAHGKSTRCHLVARAPESQFRDTIAGVAGVESVAASGHSVPGEVGLTVETGLGADVRPAMARAVLEHGWDLLELRQQHVTLEDVFIDLVTEESDEESPIGDSVMKEAAS
ncbi:MAG TPA: ATP-binding cassette domain-containing protein [Desulfomonilaceae bacterium]|nr:ATP-binding cassette domain-containing protein [Desulfomonilaceae bacterium]